jgi:hypothetical protein
MPRAAPSTESMATTVKKMSNWGADSSKPTSKYAGTPRMIAFMASKNDLES